MDPLEHLLAKNKQWAQKVEAEKPGFFQKLSNQQNPKFLWIGCSDSRVPANEITGLDPGEVFVHRNVANQVLYSDINCLSATHYAINELEVEHVIVCGHYGCGGVHAVVKTDLKGIVESWLGGLRDVYWRYRSELEAMGNQDDQARVLCEINVLTQVRNLCRTSVVHRAWSQNRSLTIHGWIYDLKDGLLRDLNVTVEGPEQVEELFRTRIDKILKRKS